MQIPEYAVFRCGQRVPVDEYTRLSGSAAQQELAGGVLVGAPSALCWPPPASFTWDWKRLLSEEDYQAISSPPGWQTEWYRGVVVAWTMAEAEAIPAELDQYRQVAKQWIDRHVPAILEE